MQQNCFSCVRSLARLLLIPIGMTVQAMVTPGRSKKLGTALASALGLLALLWLIYLGLTWDLRSSAREPDAAFEPVAVARGDLPETVVATGVLEPSARRTALKN